jgi:hypothetical protein
VFRTPCSNDGKNSTTLSRRKFGGRDKEARWLPRDVPAAPVRRQLPRRRGCLYEAGALALQQFRRSDWSREASLDAGALRVEVRESTFYNVKVAELEAWLKRTGGAPRDIIARQKVRSRLGS